MELCLNCGAELKPEAKFCAACGTKVIAAKPPPAEAEPQPQHVYQQQEPVYEHAREASNAFKEAISGKTNLIQRVINILTKPKDEWQVILSEQPDTMKLIGGYALILALIPAVSAFIKYGLIGSAYYFGTGIQKGIVQFLTAVIGVYILAWVINELAPSFESEKNFGRSLQLAVYASTPQWVAGILMLISPGLSMLFGLYAIYLIAVGLPVLKKTPQEKVLAYVALTIIAMIVIALVLALIFATILGFFFVATMSGL